MSTIQFVAALRHKEGQQITKHNKRKTETTGEHESYWELMVVTGLYWFTRPAGSINTICVVTVTTRRGKQTVRPAGFNKDEVQEKRLHTPGEGQHNGGRW